jgi:hypothetical protein
MTGHFTSYKTRPNHELATFFRQRLGSVNGRSVSSSLAGGGGGSLGYLVGPLREPSTWVCRLLQGHS